MNQTLKDWVSASQENARLFAQERLIVRVAESIWERMEQQRVSKVEIATVLGKSKAFITQLLNGSRNMTLRTLSDIAFALDSEVEICVRPKSHGEGWRTAAVQEVESVREVIPVNFNVRAAQTPWTTASTSATATATAVAGVRLSEAA